MNQLKSNIGPLFEMSNQIRFRRSWNKYSNILNSWIGFRRNQIASNYLIRSEISNIHTTLIKCVLDYWSIIHSYWLWNQSKVHMQLHKIIFQCLRQSISCRSRLSVEQSSITCHPLSPSSAVVLNHISSHFLIPLSDFSLICTVPAPWLIILDTIIALTF